MYVCSIMELMLLTMYVCMCVCVSSFSGIMRQAETLVEMIKNVVRK